jgi:hypothetical protein
MIDQEMVVNNPHFVCAAAHLCRSVGNQTSMMSLCINCNQSAHHFAPSIWTSNIQSKNPSLLQLKISRRRVRSASTRKCLIPKNVMSCSVYFASIGGKQLRYQLRLRLLLRLLRRIKTATLKRKKKLTTASVAVIRELRRVAAFYSQVYIFTKVEKAH